MKHITAAIMMAAIPLLVGGTASAGEFVEADGTKLMLNGREYRAIGVNVPHLSQAYIGTWFHIRQIYGTPEKARQAVIDAITDAGKSQLAFIRFFANPGYPKDTQFYLEKPDEYWELMDELFDLCRKNNVKLIPSIGALFGWNKVCGEDRQAALDPNTKTYKAMYKYVREMVSRYKDDTNVLMWELGNEYFLAADVNMTDRRAPGKGIYPENATVIKEKYTLNDSMTFSMLQKFYKEMTAYIKSIDPNHLVTSGDSGVREESMSRREGFPNPKFRVDTVREHLSNLLVSQDKPLDVFSVHNYGNFTTRKKVGNLPHLDYLLCRIRSIHSSLSPVFVGELGQTNPYFKDEPEAKWTRAAIDLLEKEGAALVAVWVWHFPWQPNNTITNTSHPLLTKRIAEFNRKYAGSE